ncbi:xanthine dehydrogenase family protein molybdopterin-binding subunit [Paraburkholderia lycopersici]|uniref:Xanthine dehydrogenase YagR molybdenum-binding subunit n=1 Tax=Paraburkholderia lycopersici TaxID=416944 RepID=A0A1G6H7A2_9BURK|nr:xanthine dehydrogenase family protein molybdopterin-binding subunit [Paraburkholderia lycopersici]SDB90157.1 xanthine dehydrogenase YagR molybdenum-binding subunit [Paraburkholderia lycopersici]
MSTVYEPRSGMRAGAHIGAPVSRVDGRSKVTGAARYAAEFGAPGLVHGAVVNATIARGEIVSIDASAAQALPGVLHVLTHENRPALAEDDAAWKDQIAPGGTPFRPLAGTRVRWAGQPVALVVAQTRELAHYAASLVRVRYRREPHRTELASVLTDAVIPSTGKGGFEPPPEPRGHAYRALASAHARTDAFYSTPMEFHQPMEMHGCTVVPSADGRFTVYEKTQGVSNTQQYLMKVFGLQQDRVRVISPFVGGAFGSGLRPQYHLPLAMMAARTLRRPVRVALTRAQMFTFGHRPASIQHVALGARSDGRLAAIVHEAVGETSQFEDFTDVVVNWAGQLYRAPNVQLGYKLGRLDVYTPLDMRAPGATQGLYALECAMDELAVALEMDPLELRIRNYADEDPSKHLPYSSKALLDCYAQGAERFGWGARIATPRAMRDGHELVGYGMATGMWDAMQTEASVRAVLNAQGRLELSSATADIGTGTYTAISQIAADALHMGIDNVAFTLGDTSLPPAPIEGGSWTVSSVGSAASAACAQLRSRLAQLLPAHGGVAFANLDPAMLDAALVIEDGEVRVHGATGRERARVRMADLLADAGMKTLEEQVTLKPEAIQKRFSMATHSAVFAEVRVDETLGVVRVARVVSAIAAGRIVNPKTAANQIAGGVVWGIGMALQEHAQFDHTLGRIMNHNLAEYHMPVNRDVGEIDVLFVDEHDDVVNPLGAKGVGEIGVVGVAAAIANAVFNATGKRVRDLPITLDKLL